MIKSGEYENVYITDSIPLDMNWDLLVKDCEAQKSGKAPMEMVTKAKLIVDKACNDATKSTDDSIIDGNGKALINEYVHPYWKKEWAAAARVNGITPEMVKDAPYPHDLIPKVKGIFEAADILVAYNNQFDLSFLRRWGISDSGKEQYDVMLEFAQEYGEWNEYFGDYKWQKLSTAASYYGYKFKAHDSLEDVRATLYVYKKLQAQESGL